MPGKVYCYIAQYPSYAKFDGNFLTVFKGI